MIGKTNATNILSGEISNQFEDIILIFTTNNNNNDALVGAIINISYDDVEIEGIYSTTGFTIKIPAGKEVYIKINKIPGYYTPSNSEHSFITIANNIRTINAVYEQLMYTTIRLDQGSTDPASMVTLLEDTGGIQAIRDNSHRYLGKYTGDNEMTICQLDDLSTKHYYDASGISQDDGNIYGYAATDVWMKLPKFYYKAVNNTNTGSTHDIWDIYVSYLEVDDETEWNLWDGRDLIGAYEGYVKYSRLYSVFKYSTSSITSTGNLSHEVFKNYSRNRGNGYTLVKWKHHCVMAFLFMMYYKHTDSQIKCGRGVNSTDKLCGNTNELGMKDTVGNGGNGDGRSINFWGLENWWGNKYELIDNVIFDSDTFDWDITEDDGTIRHFDNASWNGTATDSSYISKFYIGDKLDLIPRAFNGSSSTGYCDAYNITVDKSNIVATRSCANYSKGGGAFYLSLRYDINDTADVIGSRLAFRGTIIEEKNINTFKGIQPIQ